jgi:hypothetical protein
MTKSPEKEFHVGLTMSGAISAGAYTAGVFDFLIQALAEWEKARSGEYKEVGIDPNNIPNHRVGIQVMSGASAGAITAAIGVVALADAGQIAKAFESVPAAGKQKIEYLLPKLYDTWVTRPALVAEKQGNSDFLTGSDLDGPAKYDFSRTSGVPAPTATQFPPVVSLLNARLLDEIADAAIDVQKVIEEKDLRPYISKTLHVYMTLSNLRGVPYEVPFDGGPYHMISHGDRVHYAVTGIGGWPSFSEFADNDPKRAIQAEWLVNGHTEKPQWKDFSICALASSAFPIGLAPRDVGARLDEYDGRRFPIENLVNRADIKPSFLKQVIDAPPWWFRTSDGGIIDNDPFEYARFSLKEAGKLEQAIEPRLDKVDRAVIMISPFPELKPIEPAGKPASDIVSILSALMPSLIDQVRFKPSELALAADPDYGSRYLIGPSRTIKLSSGVEKKARYAIASGLLSGFGGFVAQPFRAHDFQLGRRNCQRFLQATFALPPENPLFADWLPNPAAARFKALESQYDKGKTFYSILPLFGSAADEVAPLKWPQITDGQFSHVMNRIGRRFDEVAPLLVAQNVKGILGGLIRFLLLPGIRDIPGLVRAKFLNYVRLTILADLVRRNQIQGWDLGNLPSAIDLDEDDVRFILAELVAPTYDQRNVAGLLTAATAVRPANPQAPAITKDKIAKLLDEWKVAKGKPYEVWQAPWTDKNGDPLFTLASRVPNMLEQLISQTGVAFKPTVDPPGV